MYPNQTNLKQPFNFTLSNQTAQISNYDLNPRLSISLPASKDSYYPNNELSIRIDQEARSEYQLSRTEHLATFALSFPLHELLWTTALELLI